jgi:hypothetical protein
LFARAFIAPKGLDTNADKASARLCQTKNSIPPAEPLGTRHSLTTEIFEVSERPGLGPSMSYKFLTCLVVGIVTE